jgi:hypothetical protein
LNRNKENKAKTIPRGTRHRWAVAEFKLHRPVEPKAALKRTHSKRNREASAALAVAERLECVRFSAAFELP